ncbi:hypothetical protein ABZ599_38805 [Streptomyces misionensis]|uniref:hypothetical protein n=1 Tax=Streptomyces misionensis TaxID=67331 RepID=UPI0033D140CF
MSTDFWHRINEIEASRRAKKEAEEKAAAEAARKGPRVIARYLTEAGKALADRALCVTVTEAGPRDDDGRAESTVSDCQVCPAINVEYWETVTYDWSDRPTRRTVTEAAESAEHKARKWAENHAAQCRALPVEG